MPSIATESEARHGTICAIDFNFHEVAGVTRFRRGKKYDKGSDETATARYTLKWILLSTAMAFSR